MAANQRTATTMSAQVNVWMVVAMLIPAAAIFALGYLTITQFTVGGQSIDSTTLWVITSGLTVLAAVVIAVSVMRIRAVVRNRMLELAEVCRRVSIGERNLRVPVAGQDEFAILSSSLNAMLSGAPLGAAGRASIGEMPDAAVLQAQIEKLLQEVSAVGDGDLRVQAEVTPDTLGVLADSFNYMIEELAKVVGRVQATALQVTNATRRLLDRSAEVAQASETQAYQINQTSDSVTRLADFVQLSASNALTAVEAAREALTSAQSGQEAVVQTSEGMGRIRENVQETSKKIKRLGERSQEVSEIVRLIEDIADQTNLLALNAAIQSAMAGEHGRGFAVVADEIRALAERVTEATKKISTIVKSIQGDTFEAVVAMEESTQEVVAGSQLADAAGQSLQSIYNSVERQSKIVEGIVTAASDRKRTAEAVASSMSQIADIARQTNSATQDASDSVSYLAELAEQLRASVATFRLPEQIAEAAGIGAIPGQGYTSQGNLPPYTDGPPAGWGDPMPNYPALPAGAPAEMATGVMTGPGMTGPGMTGPSMAADGGFSSGFTFEAYADGMGEYAAPATNGGPPSPPTQDPYSLGPRSQAPLDYPEYTDQPLSPTPGAAAYPPDRYDGHY